MSTFSIKLDKKKINDLKQAFKEYITSNPNEYIDTFIRKDDLTISIYKSEKVVFQGNDAFFYASAYLDEKKSRQAGSDEVGTGDYFGPVIVVSVIIEEEDYPFIEENGITDSKKMTDEKVLQLGKQLMQRFKHSLLILDNCKYNKVHETNNLNAIKAKLHNQAYINLLKKGYQIPKAAYVDQFAKEDSYYRYLANEKEVYHDLIFETKAEAKYPAVAVASVIARYAFLTCMKNLEDQYQLRFHKGAGEDTNADAIAFINKYGKDKLGNVAKLHFKNTEVILNSILENHWYNRMMKTNIIFFIKLIPASKRFICFSE